MVRNNKKKTVAATAALDSNDVAMDDSSEYTTFFEYVSHCDRCDRLSRFEEVYGLIEDDRTYWRILAYVWIDTEFPNRNRLFWIERFADCRPGREFMMNEKEQAFLASLPDELIVYRGCSGTYRLGFSWTYCREIALKFARRFADEGDQMWVTEGRCLKARVLAFLNDRNEKEIVIDPKNVKKRQRFSVPAADCV
jgi:hypothetical protein